MQCHRAECRNFIYCYSERRDFIYYAGGYYAECRDSFIVVLNVIMLSVAIHLLLC